MLVHAFCFIRYIFYLHLCTCIALSSCMNAHCQLKVTVATTPAQAVYLLTITNATHRCVHDMNHHAAHGCKFDRHRIGYMRPIVRSPVMADQLKTGCFDLCISTLWVVHCTIFSWNVPYPCWTKSRKTWMQHNMMSNWVYLLQCKRVSAHTPTAGWDMFSVLHTAINRVGHVLVLLLPLKWDMF